MATGYLNLQKEFLKVIASNKKMKTDLLTSSPRANGFYNGGLIKKHIPGIYRINEYKVLK